MTSDAKHGRFGIGPALMWLVLFGVLALSPLALAMVGPVPAPRPFFEELGVGLGFVGMGILALQFVTTGRFQFVAPVFGSDVVLQFHKQIGIAAVLMVLAHPVVLIATEPEYLEFFDPRVNLLRAIALTTAVPAMVLLLVTSIWRERFGLSYEWWRVAHGVLALAVVFIGMVHGIQVGEYLGVLWKQGVWAGVLLGAMYLVVHSRVVRPMRMKGRPYEIIEVTELVDDTTAIKVEPVGHVGMAFSAGQFAWITVGDSPYSMQQHPFSFSSSERDGAIGFTAKALGDFTEKWPDFEPGQRVFLEGPYGGFILDPNAEGAVFIAGGIGVTPMMSILRTMRDHDDRRPALLFYGNSSEGDIALRDEIDELSRVLELEVIHVLEDAPDEWDGEEGYIDGDLLRRRLPDDCRNFDYFICGPDPMMDAAESALRDMGVAWRQIYTERFQIV